MMNSQEKTDRCLYCLKQFDMNRVANLKVKVVHETKEGQCNLKKKFTNKLNYIYIYILPVIEQRLIETEIYIQQQQQQQKKTKKNEEEKK